MRVAVVVVFAAAAGPDERSLAEAVVEALRARGLSAAAASATPDIDFGASVAAIDEAYAAMDASRATRLSDELVVAIQSPAGARLSADEIASAFARRALAARLAGDSDAERLAIDRACPSGTSVLSESDYPAWLREAVASRCSAELAGTLRVESASTGAVVRVDGIPRGVAPIDVRLPLGSHVVHVVAPDAIPYATTVNVRTEGASVFAPAAAGYSHRVLVRRGEDGVLYLRVQLTTRGAGDPAREIATSGPELDPGEIDSLVRAIAPPNAPPARRRRAQPGLPAWVWVATGAAVVAAGGVGVWVATSGTDEWRGVVEMP